MKESFWQGGDMVDVESPFLNVGERKGTEPGVRAPVKFVGDLGQVRVIWALVLSSVRRLVGPADLS